MRTKRRLELFILSAVALLIAGGCSDKKEATPAVLLLSDYYPMQAGSHWAYAWSNDRGDAWNGSISVSAASSMPDGKEFTVIDSLVRSDVAEVTVSLYRMTPAGLLHVYKISSRDSTAFSPPRMVFPYSISAQDTIWQSYQYSVHRRPVELHDGASESQLTGGVNVTFSATSNLKPAEVESQWPDCILLEVKRFEASQPTNRTRLWLAKGVGPVKIESGRISESGGGSVEESGRLTYQR